MQDLTRDPPDPTRTRGWTGLVSNSGRRVKMDFIGLISPGVKANEICHCDVLLTSSCFSPYASSRFWANSSPEQKDLTRIVSVIRVRRKRFAATPFFLDLTDDFVVIVPN